MPFFPKKKNREQRKGLEIRNYLNKKKIASKYLFSLKTIRRCQIKINLKRKLQIKIKNFRAESFLSKFESSKKTR